MPRQPPLHAARRSRILAAAPPREHRRVPTAPPLHPAPLADAAPGPVLRAVEPLRPRAAARSVPRLPRAPGARARLPEPAAPHLDPIALRGRGDGAQGPVVLGAAPRSAGRAPPRRVPGPAPGVPRDDRAQPPDARPAGSHPAA